MARGIFESPLVRIVNGVAVGLIKAPILGNLIGRGLVVVRYVGRRSGKTFEIPVGYRRTGDALVREPPASGTALAVEVAGEVWGK